MSHGACRPVSASVLGETLAGPEDIKRMAAKLALNSMDLLQAPHTWSGIEMALVGSARPDEGGTGLEAARLCEVPPEDAVCVGPVRRHAGADASRWARDLRAKGFRAVKFGWAPFGDSLQGDIDQLDAARQGLGPDGISC